MKAKALMLVMLLGFVFAACKSEDVTSPLQNPSYTGQYQSVPYGDSASDPTVILLLTESDNNLNGTGTWNGIPFNFSGTRINSHVLLNFKLTGTNIGDLNGDIDTYIGKDLTLAGGYNLFNGNYIFSGAIRFKKVAI